MVLDENPMVLTVDWSDGTATWQDGVNGPTDEMRATTPDPNGNQDFFRPVERCSPKEYQWLSKLATWLVETHDKDLYERIQGRKFILSELPTNYRLFEHVRVPGPVCSQTGASWCFFMANVCKGSTVKARTDTYLYGHPKGPRKRYRSLAEFKPHFLWLASDPTRNPRNCECRVCRGKTETSTEQAESPAAPSRRHTPAPSTTGKGAAPAHGKRTGTSTTPAAPGSATSRRSTSTATSAAATTSRSTTSTPAPATLPTPVPFSYRLSAFADSECNLDSAPGKNIFRPGELVWCHCTEAWSLGVIVARPGPDSHGYTVQVLKSPLEAEMSKPYPGITLSGLRPWLAWSTPEITIAPLREILEYDSINWAQYRKIRGLEVDASIIKSRDIDTSYCLIEKLECHNGNFYAGVFYGAEKIWMGEIVRLKRQAVPQANSTGLEVMVVAYIEDKRQQSATTSARTASTDIIVVGDIYEPVVFPVSATSIPPQIPQWLPPRLIAETKLKNQVTSSSKSQTPTVGTWKCIQQGLPVRLEDIKGRWYESSILIPELKGYDTFQQALSAGNWDELATQMNEMGNAGQASVRGWKRNLKRNEVLTKAVPKGFVLEKEDPNQVAYSRREQRETVDLTGEDEDHKRQNNQHVWPSGDPPPGGLTMEEDEQDDAIMRQMQEDVESFLTSEPADSFYGGL